MGERQPNNVSTAKECRLRGDEWKALESLHPEVRRALREALVDWCPLWVRRKIRAMVKRGWDEEGAAFHIACMIPHWDAEEVEGFAANKWPPNLGPYPHLAADVPLQTYSHHRGMPS